MSHSHSLFQPDTSDRARFVKAFALLTATVGLLKECAAGDSTYSTGENITTPFIPTFPSTPTPQGRSAFGMEFFIALGVSAALVVACMGSLLYCQYKLRCPTGGYTPIA